MEKGRATPTSCPDPETLAAWLDRGLGATERAVIEAHLASCDDCRAIVARVIETPYTPVKPPSRVARWAAGGVLAIAAMLIVLVQLQPGWWQHGSRDSVDSRLADLADAVAEHRTVEGRLTGGFRHGPLRAPVRSGGSSGATTDNWTLFAAAGKIREHAEREPTPANLHALGLAYLVLGEHDNAVRALEDAVGAEPREARYHSDLAAAYLARARQADRPDDFPRALSAAERAVAVDPGLLEARFNRALALEALFLEDQTRRAWEEYLARDGASGWADEARRHLQALPPTPPELARNNSPPEITTTSVEAGLGWLLRQGLPAWADAVLERDTARASRLQQDLITYAAHIVSMSSDPFASSLVAITEGDDAQTARYARAIAGFARGLAHLDADDLPAAEREFVTACRTATGALEMLCHIELGTFDVMRRESTAAGHSAEVVRQASEASGETYLLGRAFRLSAYKLIFAGDYAGALAAYKNALDAFSTGRYAAQAGSMAAQIGDLYDLVGLSVDAWRWRQVALEAVTKTWSPSFRYGTWMTTGWSLARASNHEASRAFLQASEADSRERSGLQRVPLLLGQARAALSVGDVVSSRAALENASRTLTNSTDFRAERMSAEVLTLKATLAWTDGDANEAERLMGDAMAAMGPERISNRATALLQRAQIRASSSSQLDAAETDLKDGIALLRSRGLSSPQPVRMEDVDAAFQSAATIIAARPMLNGVKGLALVEELRELLAGDPTSAPVTPDHLDDVAAQLPPGAAVVCFLFGRDSLLAWALTSKGTRFTQRQIKREDIQRLVVALSAQVARAPARDEVWRGTLATMYDVLLRDLPEEIAQATMLAIVPDGPLNLVPFAALFDTRANAFVFERTAVRIAPTVALAVRHGAAPSVSAPAAVVSIGDPTLVNAARSGFRPLPRAREEALRVATLYPKSHVLLGGDATKVNLLQRLTPSTTLHFAGHGVLPAGGSARLLLAGPVEDPSRALTASDLKGRIDGTRIVLAACETAGGNAHDRALGVASLAGRFLQAGAVSVVATLWKVDDAASGEFFVNVHRGLLAGQSAARAVASAQRACRASMTCRDASSTWIGTTVYGSE